ncbi:hypothetical protein PoMZ_11479 [Pyricularia oryzae]|uniref:Tumor suppressor candidate 4 n=1 Tax=Pyricularia oryzae TaxID=318829 RepID=A0A4P7NKN0_PYROR|nr:hypothetical protein PoMZ_11479 [Pyricularia oryzae]
MIQGIFYARFLPQEGNLTIFLGTKIVAQSPPGCIVPSEGATKAPLLDFDVLQEYIIPRKAFFNRYVTVRDPDGKYSVLGFPVSIFHPKYHRNEFIFNFGLVVDAGLSAADQLPYERVVRRLAVTFAELEKQNEYLSALGGGLVAAGPVCHSSSAGYDDFSARRPIEGLLEIVREDLNNYGECMIPVDDANAINMKLFPYHPVPPQVKGWHVPVAKLRLADVVDDTWDLTMQKVIAHIDGVNDVRRIAFLADVSIDLTQLALRHLLYYDTVLLLDMFFFGSCYAPRPSIHEFIANLDGVVDECAAYVCVMPPGPSSSGGGGGNGGGDASSGSTINNHHFGSRSSAETSPTAHHHHYRPSHPGTPPRVSNFLLVKLMTSFCAGRTVMEWLKVHLDTGFDVLRFVDVRRLVQFGVIKGFLYRVHKHVVSKQYIAALATGQARPSRDANADPLQRYTDGRHCFDQIITEQNLADPEILDRLRNLPLPPGDLTVFYR